jgi:hypothetical protein
MEYEKADIGKLVISKKFLILYDTIEDAEFFGFITGDDRQAMLARVEIIKYHGKGNAFYVSPDDLVIIVDISGDYRKVLYLGRAGWTLWNGFHRV